MEIVFRAAFIFAFLWFITRVSGRAVLGELSTFELLLYITMGDLVQQAVTQQDYSVTSAVLAVGVFCLLTVALTWVNARSRRLRPLTHGTPIVIVERGELVTSNLHTERVSTNDLMAAARNQGIERFGDVRLAVLESNGRISFFTADSESGATDPPPVG
jgi:uncharacterized membrane protein YcaP (DUF421 family)